MALIKGFIQNYMRSIKMKGQNKMEEILEKIDNHSKEVKLIAGDLIKEAINNEDEEEKFELFNASEVLQNISTALKNIRQELKKQLDY